MKKLLHSLAFSLLALSASAASFSPLQIGFDGFKGQQLVSSNTPVIGLCLNLPGAKNDTVTGLDIGISSFPDTFTGLRLNLFYSLSDTCNGATISFLDWSFDTLNGLQLSVIGFGETIHGIQLAGIGVVGALCGMQIGAFPASVAICGAQLGLANRVDSLHGLQIGPLNFACNLDDRHPADRGTVHGLQIGLVNYAHSLHGLQIGLLNIVLSSPYPYLPLLRVSF